MKQASIRLKDELSKTKAHDKRVEDTKTRKRKVLIQDGESRS